MGTLLLIFCAAINWSNALEGHFVFQGQQQTLSTDAESEFLVSLLTPKTRDVFFGPVLSLSPQFEGDSLIQYEVLQEVRINHLVFNKATYFEFKDFVQVTVGEPGSDNYFTFRIGNSSLSFIESVQLVNSDSVQKTHWVESTLQKNDI